MALIKSKFDVVTLLSAVAVLLLAAWQAVDYFQFRGAGGRFTAQDGEKLCLAHRELAEHVGYKKPLPICDYLERNGRE
jgi:hypothetical protein